MKKNKLTKKQKKEHDIIIATCLFLFLIFSVADMLNSLYTQHKVNKIEKQQEIIIERQIIKEEVSEQKIKEIKKEVEIIKKDSELNKEQVKKEILRIAKEEKFKWPSYLIRLAQCESQFNPKAINDKNNNPESSKDRGLFQFNSYWQSQVDDKCAFSIECSTKKAMEMINNGYQHRWVCNNIILKK